MTRSHFLLVLAALGWAATPLAHGAVAYDEAVSGDLPSTFSGTTTGVLPNLNLSPGSNEIHGTTGRGGTIDRDYFSVTVPEGYVLGAITVLSGTGFGGALSQSFLGIQTGNEITVNPAGGSATGLLGWTHYSADDIGNDILGQVGTGAGASGFVPPLPSGPYAFWIQEAATGSYAYGFDFQVTPVPLPAAAYLFMSGLGLIGWRRRSDRSA